MSFTYVVYNSAAHTDWDYIESEGLKFGASLRNANPNRWPYRSLFGYEHRAFEKFRVKQVKNGQMLAGGSPSLAGLGNRGIVLDAKVVGIDIDAEIDFLAHAQALSVCQFLSSKGVPYYVWFSGKKGYHIEIHKSVIGYKPDPELPDQMKRFVRALIADVEEQKGVTIDLDDGIYEPLRKWRMPNNRRKRGTHKILISKAILEQCSSDEIRTLSRTGPKKVPSYGEQAQNGYLAKLWDEAKEPPQELVEVFRTTNRRANYTNIDGLEKAFLALPGAREETWQGTRVIKHPCQHPKGHSSGVYDLSTGFFPETGWVYCHHSTCGKNHPPKVVADYMGFTLEEETQEFRGIDEAREELQSNMDAVLDGDGNALFIQPTGVGKSTAAVRAILNLDLKALYLGDNHRLLGEIYAKMGHGTHLRTYYKAESRCLNLDMPEAESVVSDMPDTWSRSDEIQRRFDLDMPKWGVCSGCPLNPHSDRWDEDLANGTPCKHLDEKHEAMFGKPIKVQTGGIFGQLTQQAGGVDIVKDSVCAAKAYLKNTATFRRLAEGRDVVIIDEDVIDYLLDVRCYDLEEIEKYRWDTRQIRLSGSGTSAQVAYSDPDIQVRRDPETGKEVFSCELGYIIRSVVDKKTVPGRDPSVDYASLVADSEQHLIQPDIWDLVADDGSLGLPNWSLGLSDEVTSLLNVLKDPGLCDVRVIREGSEGFLSVRFTKSLPEGPQYVLLDATASETDIKILEHLVPDGFEVFRCDVENPETELIHDPSCSYSRGSQDLNLKRHDAGDVDGMDRYAATTAYLARCQGQGATCVISQKDGPFVTRWLSEGLLDPDDLLWFGALRGIDKFSHYDHLIVLGDPGLPLIAYETEKHRMGVDGHKHLMTIGSGHEDPDGYYKLNYKTLHPDTVVGSYIHARKIRNELEQAVGRIRGLSNNCTITLLSSFTPIYRDQYTYTLDTRLILSESRVELRSDHDEILYRVNGGFETLREISRDTGINRKKLASMQKDSRRNRLIEVIKFAKKQGHGVAEIADAYPVSKKTIYKYLKENKENSGD